MRRKVIRRTAAENPERDIRIGLHHRIYDGVHRTIPTCGKHTVRAHLTKEATEIILPAPLCTIGTEHDSMLLEQTDQGVELPFEKCMTRNGVIDQP